MNRMNFYLTIKIFLITVICCLSCCAYSYEEPIKSNVYSSVKTEQFDQKNTTYGEVFSIIPDNRPSEYEYAVLSKNVYNDIKQGDIVNINSEEWGVISTKRGNSGYFAALYRNDKTKQLVLAHRGTQSFGSVMADLHGIILNQITSQHEAAYYFTKEAVEEAKKSNVHLSTTGHSLGALLAELSVYWCHDKFNYEDINAVTFESPGSREIIEGKMFPNLVNNSIDLEKLDIVQYLSYPNIVNTWGHHIGTVYQIEPMLGNLGWVSGWYTKQAHSISNIVKIFEKSEAKTRILMQDWPLGVERSKYFDKAMFLNGKYSLTDLESNKEFGLYYKGHYVQYTGIDIKRQILLKHFNPALRNFLIDFFQVHKHLLTEEESSKALVRYWHDLGVPDDLINLIVKYKIDQYRNADRISIIAEYKIETWRRDLSLQLSQNSNFIQKLLLPLKQESTINGLVIIEDKSFLDNNILNTKSYTGEVHRTVRGTPEAIANAQKKGFNPANWQATLHKKSNENHLTISDSAKIVNSEINIEDHKNNIYEEYEFIDNNKNIRSLISPWNTPYLPGYFVRRTEIRNKIIAKLARNDKKLNHLTIVGLNGLGGVGKTYLALDIIYNPAKDYSFRGWITASDKVKLKTDYFKLGYELGLIKNDIGKEEKIATVKNWLNSQESLLLVFDNVPDMEIIEKYLPQKGDVIITSRNYKIPSAIEIDGMVESEALELLKNLISDPKCEDKCADLVKKLDYLPLAISQAGAYIEQNKITIDKYMKLYKEEQATLLSSDVMPVSDKHMPVYITWSLSLREIKEKDKTGKAIELLNLIAFCNFVDIPKSLLIEYLYGTTDSKTEMEFNKIISFLRQYSLLKIASDTIAIHNLVQDCVRANMEQQEKKIILKNAIISVKKIYPMENNEAKDYELVKTLLPHMDSLLVHSKKEHVKQQDIVQLIIYTADCYNRLGGYLRARILSEEALSIQESYYGTRKHIEIANTINNLGRIFSNIGDYKKARTLLERRVACSSLYSFMYLSIVILFCSM